MPDLKLLALACSLPARAEEVLARSETMDDAEARLAMREIAASYERFAQRVDEHSFEADEA